MKKTNRNRLVAFTLAIVMILSMFVGCTNQQGREDYKNAVETKHNQQQSDGGTTESPNTGNSNNGNSGTDNTSAQIAQIQEQINNLTTEFNAVKAENEALKGENVALKAENEGYETENTALKTENSALKTEKTEIQTENFNLKVENKSLEKMVEELKNQSTHQIVVKDGVIWVHIEDFLYAANGVGALISAEDGTGYALRTLKGVHVKVYDDECGDEHLVPDFDLPMQDYYTIVLTADEGKTAFTANFGNYNWANRGLVTSFQATKFVKELSSMPKNGGSGKQFYNLIKATAVVVSENGTYRFALDADNYGANPVIKPAEPQVIVKEVCKICGKQDCEGHIETQTVKVCMICGAKDCKGHVETKVETETVKVCMICGAKDCKGHVETKVETETIMVCMICGAKDCKGHVETKVETETIMVCMICGNQNCGGHVETKVETETVKVCMICGKQNCNGHVEKETVEVKYCGRCGYLWEKCICDDEPANNTENPGKDDLIDDLKGNQENNSTNTGFGDFVDDLKNNQTNSSNNNTQSGATNNSGNSTNNSGWQTNNTNTNTNTNNNTTNSGFAGLVDSLT